MHVANETVRRNAKTKRFDNNLFYVTKTTKHTTYNATINLNFTTTMKQLKIINFSTLMLNYNYYVVVIMVVIIVVVLIFVIVIIVIPPPPLPGMHLTMRLVVAS